MTERELTLADYLAMLRRRWMLIVVLALVGGPLAYGVSRFLPDRYKSQTLVLVERPSVPEKIVAITGHRRSQPASFEHAATDPEPIAA